MSCLFVFIRESSEHLNNHIMQWHHEMYFISKENGISSCTTALRKKKGHAACLTLLFQFYFPPFSWALISLSVFLSCWSSSFLLSAEILSGQGSCRHWWSPGGLGSSLQPCFLLPLSSERIQPASSHHNLVHPEHLLGGEWWRWENTGYLQLHVTFSSADHRPSQGLGMFWTINGNLLATFKAKTGTHRVIKFFHLDLCKYSQCIDSFRHKLVLQHTGKHWLKQAILLIKVITNNNPKLQYV